MHTSYPAATKTLRLFTCGPAALRIALPLVAWVLFFFVWTQQEHAEQAAAQPVLAPDECEAILGEDNKIDPKESADWPMWRGDPARRGASGHELPRELKLQWVRQLPALKPAWPDQPSMQQDEAYEPVVLGKTLYFGSSRTDCLTALETATGKERWRFQADGPIRYAPVAAENSVYFTADDGYLYCLDAEEGTLRWKVRGGPNERKVLGNERLVSMWPARGAPVLADGTVYFAASIWPFMGIFIHAVDAKTGAVQWTNDGDGSIYIKQPHMADSFAGVAPQGYLAVAGTKLLIPGGRSIPAVYERKTGKMVKYQLGENGRRGGGAAVYAFGNYFINGGGLFEMASQKFVAQYSEVMALTDKVIYTCETDKAKKKGTYRAYSVRGAGFVDEEEVDKRGNKTKSKNWKLPVLATIDDAPLAEVIIKAGSRIYAGGKDHITVLDFLAKTKRKVTAELGVPGTVVRLIAADERLIAVTREGLMYCYGADPGMTLTHPHRVVKTEPDPFWNPRAKQILDKSQAREGYCVAWGAGSGGLVLELARQSKLRIIVVEPNEKRAQALRTTLLERDLYGERVAVHHGELNKHGLPPYLASLVVAEELDDVAAASIKQLYPVLRPYGGVAYLPYDAAQLKLAIDMSLPNAKLSRQDEWLVLTRAGAPPGAGNWTHEHADAANTRVGKDKLAKAPLGLLWFGGTSNEGVLPRHGHGPQPQVVDGRLIIEGVDMLRAIDIYTGRLLWQVDLPGLGKLYNNLAHQPGANSTGTNFVSMPDGIYVAYGANCLRLDPATGKTLHEISLPAVPNGMPLWGYLNVEDEYLIGGADPYINPESVPFVTDPKKGDDTDSAAMADMLKQLVKKISYAKNDMFSSSKQLVVLNRHSGKVLWTATAKFGFRHNAICIGGGRIYAIDRLSDQQRSRLKKRGQDPEGDPRLVAYDLATGKKIWSVTGRELLSKEDFIFGTWLSYSQEHDVLVEAGRVARDTLIDEPKGMRAYQGSDGKVLWYQPKYIGPAMIHGDTILKDQSACDLRTGEPKLRPDPLTGELVEWSWTRNYGCNTPMASANLLTFRSGAAGYYDLCNDGGTGNFGGFRSSCTNNLVVAGGVLTAPDYTRTCSCLYQNQTSVGLVHMPEMEMWTTFSTKAVKGTLQRVGLNFGGPGDRRADNGTLWLEYPSIAGKSPTVDVKVSGAKLSWFRRHALSVSGELNWVASSGVRGVESVTVKLGEKDMQPASYTVRLVFMEPDKLTEGERCFSVKIQKDTVLPNFDIVKEAGGPQRSLIREFTGVMVSGELTIALRPTMASPVREAVLCGIEIVAEKK